MDSTTTFFILSVATRRILHTGEFALEAVHTFLSSWKDICIRVIKDMKAVNQGFVTVPRKHHVSICIIWTYVYVVYLYAYLYRI